MTVDPRPGSTPAAPAQPAVHAQPVAQALPGADEAPDWLRPLIDAATSRPLPGRLSQMPRVAGSTPSAVLVLLSDGTDEHAPDTPGPDVLMTARSGLLRSHAGQPAFPGGRADPGEDPVATALREAQEETGLDPASVTPILELPELHLGHSGNRVVPIVAHWSSPGPVRVVDPAETSVVLRLPIADLIDPAHRGSVRLAVGQQGPAFSIADLVIWGFTGLLLDAVFELGGWNRPWPTGRQLRLPRTDVDFHRLHPEDA